MTLDGQGWIEAAMRLAPATQPQVININRLKNRTERYAIQSLANPPR
jgi:hypothetical protein